MKSDSERTERGDFVAPGQHRGEAFPPPVDKPTNDRQPTTDNQTIIINSSDGIESVSVSEDGKYGICEIKQQRRRGRRRSDGGRGDVDAVDANRHTSKLATTSQRSSDLANTWSIQICMKCLDRNSLTAYYGHNASQRPFRDR